MEILKRHAAGTTEGDGFGSDPIPLLVTTEVDGENPSAIVEAARR